MTGFDRWKRLPHLFLLIHIDLFINFLQNWFYFSRSVVAGDALIVGINSNFELYGSNFSSIGLRNGFIGEFNVYRTNTQ